MATVSPPSFSAKDPAEAIPLAFDFSAELATGELLSGTPTVTVTASLSQNGGTLDPTPDNILNGPGGLDTTRTKVVQPVWQGMDLNDYEVKVLVNTTNANKVLATAGILPVRLI